MVKCILLLRLMGGAMYWLLSKEQRADIEEIKRALTTVFAVDAFVAFEQFATQWLCDGETVNEFLAALKRLACQVGDRPPEKWIACTFVAGMSGSSFRLQRKWTLRSTLCKSSSIPGWRQYTCKPNCCSSPVTMCRCHGGNFWPEWEKLRMLSVRQPELFGYWLHPGTCNEDGQLGMTITLKVTVLQMPKDGSLCISLWEMSWGKDTSACLLPRQVNIEALPVIKLLVDGWRCIALEDSGCSKMLMCKLAYCSLRSRKAKVVTADRKTLTSLGVDTVELKIDNIHLVTMALLTVHQTLLGLDLLLGVNTIVKLGGVHISVSGEVSFAAENVPHRASITINEPDFSATFNQHRHIWTAMWKWVGGWMLVPLKNKIAEYLVPEHIRSRYENELQLWIVNYWPLPYLEELEELGLTRWSNGKQQYYTSLRTRHTPSVGYQMHWLEECDWLSEMLIQRRLATLTETIKKYNLSMDVVLVNSAVNRVDALTFVLERWLTVAQKESEPL